MGSLLGIKDSSSYIAVVDSGRMLNENESHQLTPKNTKMLLFNIEVGRAKNIRCLVILGCSSVPGMQEELLFLFEWPTLKP